MQVNLSAGASASASVGASVGRAYRAIKGATASEPDLAECGGGEAAKLCARLSSLNYPHVRRYSTAD